MQLSAVRSIGDEAVSISDVLCYQNQGLTERLMKQMFLDLPAANSLKEDMLRFLYLCGSSTFDERFAPPEIIDEAWHHFILFTRDYDAFCKHYFGKFIHHSPNTSEKQVEPGLMKKTLSCARQTFGELSLNWGASPDELSSGSCVSDCTQCSGSTNCQT